MRKDCNNGRTRKLCAKVPLFAIVLVTGLTVLSGCGQSSSTKVQKSEPNSNGYTSGQELEEETVMKGGGSDSDTPKTENLDTGCAIQYRWVVDPVDDIEILGMAYSDGPQSNGEYFTESYSDGEYYAYGERQVDSTGSVVNNGLYIAKQGEKYGLVDCEANWVVSPDYIEIGHGSDLYCFTLKENIIEDLSGAVVPEVYTLDSQNKLYKSEWPYIFGTSGHGFAIWDSDKNVAATAYLADGGVLYDENDFPKAVGVRSWHVQDGILDYTDSPRCAIMVNGSLVSDFVFDAVRTSQDGMLAVKQNGKWGYANENGEIVIPCQYEAFRKKNTHPFDELAEIDQLYPETVDLNTFPADFTDGYVVVFDGSQYALLDSEGNEIIPFGELEELSEIHDGRMWAKESGKWGVIELA